MIDIIFYLIAAVLIIMAVMAISMTHPVHAVLSLIGTFVAAAVLFIMVGAEYLGATLIIVYVGAVTVLFLFVVMMLDSHAIKKPAKPKSKLYLLAIAAAAYMIYFLINAFNSSGSILPVYDAGSSDVEADHNTLALGKILYTHYFLAFQLSGLVLLVAMIGAIMLTIRHDKPTKRQNISKQINKSKEQSVHLVNAEKGKGVKLK